MKTKSYIIIMATATLYSCQLLKKEKLSTKTQNEKQAYQSELQSIRLNQKEHLLITDSTQSNFTILFWPKGKFSYSLARGFEGEADKVLIKGWQKNQKSVEYNNDLKQDSISLKAKYTNQKETSSTTKKYKVSTGYSWGWVLILIGFYFMYLLYKKFKIG